jgi:hypothetical protein
MSPTSTFQDAFKRAVTPGPGRLLAGVALAAAGRSPTSLSQKGMVQGTLFCFSVPSNVETLELGKSKSHALALDRWFVGYTATLRNL